MGRLVLRQARMRLLTGLIIAALLPLWLPEAPSARLWALTLLAVIAPWLVLGRDRRRRQERTRRALQVAPRGHRLVWLEFAPAAVVVITGALIGTAGALAPASVISAWALTLITWADALERRSAAPGSAWVAVLIAALVVLSAPLWLAGWFGVTSWAPWISTLSVGLHPAGAALAAGGWSTLQDPWFYSATLSGVVEARPFTWLGGLVLFTLMCVLGAVSAARAARRPERRVL